MVDLKGTTELLAPSERPCSLVWTKRPLSYPNSNRNKQRWILVGESVAAVLALLRMKNFCVDVTGNTLNCSDKFDNQTRGVQQDGTGFVKKIAKRETMIKTRLSSRAEVCLQHCGSGARYGPDGCSGTTDV